MPSTGSVWVSPIEQREHLQHSVALSRPACGGQHMLADVVEAFGHYIHSSKLLRQHVAARHTPAVKINFTAPATWYRGPLRWSLIVCTLDGSHAIRSRGTEGPRVIFGSQTSISLAPSLPSVGGGTTSQPGHTCNASCMYRSQSKQYSCLHPVHLCKARLQRCRC